MNRFIHRMRDSVVLATVLCFLQVYPPSLLAESQVKVVRLEAAIDTSAPGPVLPMALNGEASHLGRFTGRGEVVFTPGQEPGTLVGSGVVALRAANGDLIVGVMTWAASEQQGNRRTASFQVSWRDSVTFSNGEVVNNTGRFVDNRPSGFIVSVEMTYIAIIQILIVIVGPSVGRR